MRERHKLDFYATQSYITESLLQHLDIENKLVLECCAGENDITDVIKKKNKVVTNDINKAVDKDYHLDAGKINLWSKLTYDNVFPDWVITNPPYKDAHLILPNSFDACKEGCAFLLRISYLEPTQKNNPRGEWLKTYSDHLRYFMPINPRLKFRKDTTGSDSVTVAWMVWDKTFKWSDHNLKSPFQFLMY